jgi:hypothetical protein
MTFMGLVLQAFPGPLVPRMADVGSRLGIIKFTLADGRYVFFQHLREFSGLSVTSLVPWTKNRCFGCPSGEPPASNLAARLDPKLLL